jgi:hypothetical protein
MNFYVLLIENNSSVISVKYTVSHISNSTAEASNILIEFYYPRVYYAKTVALNPTTIGTVPTFTQNDPTFTLISITVNELNRFKFKKKLYNLIFNCL